MASYFFAVADSILGDQLKNLLVNTPRVIYWLQSYFGPLITDFTLIKNIVM